MSYILDALQRADQERNLGEVPKLNMAFQPDAAVRRRGWLPTALLIVFLASLVATALWLLQNGYLRFGSPPSPGEAPASESTPAVSRAGAVPAETARPAPTQSPAQTAGTTTEPDSKPTTQPQPAREAMAAQPPSTTARAETAQSTPQAGQAAATPKAAAPEPGPEPKQEPESRSARMPTPTVAPAPPPSWMRKEEAERFRQSHAPTEPVQSYLGLPQSFRDSLPKLEMSAHVFSTNPARSFVLINGKRYRIGEYLEEGPELVDILPDGAVLEHRGETFLLPVQR